MRRPKAIHSSLVSAWVCSVQTIQEQLLGKNVERFRGGLISKAHAELNHSTLGSRVIKKEKEVETWG